MRENSGVSDEDLERRVTAVEAEVVEVRREAAAARALAAGADRDVADYRAEMRAHTRSLEALRQTQIEHHAEHKAEFARVYARFDQVGARFDRVDARFEQVDARFEQVDARFEQVDGRFDQVDGRLDQIDAKFRQVDANFAVVLAGVRRIVGLLEEPEGGAESSSPR
jgi:chromosome segregation ATPase